MTSPRSAITAATLAGLLALPSAVHAGPTVLRDDQLRDLAVTPVLGRGYSLATNTFQSICLTDIARTKPSYNFDYKFEQIETSGQRSSTTSTSGSGSFGGSKFGVSVNVSASGSKTVIEGKTYTSHYIMVTIGVDVYYSSVDESKARIADPARELLTSNDIPGFFDACGMYYVRSIGRRASFVSLFSYKTESTSRDTAFEAKLDAELKGWGMHGNVSVQRSSKFSEEASSKFLTIESTAFGLGKDEKASLIAYDLETFRAAIKDAFVSMQQEDTGMVISMEVVPWVENADFQRILKLGEAKTVDGGKTISPYAQKRILNQNGEFLAEVDRVARAKLNVYYKAKQCRSQIDLDYKDQSGAFRPEWAAKKSINHRSEGTIPLTELDEAVSKANIDKLFEEHRVFLYGDGNGSSGAVACVQALLEGGITTRSHRDFPACGPVEQQFGVISGRLIDEHCMPKLTD
ncbi:MAG TPA: hypothetical protein VN253_08840 [Kofleriaceae bacterium]|nr:hypothetical protein [Kofleriaceae bacterium]